MNECLVGESISYRVKPFPGVALRCYCPEQHWLRSRASGGGAQPGVQEEERVCGRLRAIIVISLRLRFALFLSFPCRAYWVLYYAMPCYPISLRRWHARTHARTHVRMYVCTNARLNRINPAPVSSVCALGRAGRTIPCLHSLPPNGRIGKGTGP